MSSKTGLTAAEIKGDQLYGVLVRADGESADYSDPNIEKKIQAAENFYEKNLHILLGKTKLISGATQRGIVPNPAADPPEREEPGYDYDPDAWQGARWFNLKLDQRPIIPAGTKSGILDFFFAFPAADQKFFSVPHEWIRCDFQHGQINIVPSSGAVVFTFSTWFLHMATGSAYGVPKIVYVDYFAGYELATLQRDHADLLEGIKMRTVLLLGGILSNIGSGGLNSVSLSIDGLSHSRGMGGKYGRYSGLITHYLEQEELIRKTFRDHEKGPMVTFL